MRVYKNRHSFPTKQTSDSRWKRALSLDKWIEITGRNIEVVTPKTNNRIIGWEEPDKYAWNVFSFVFDDIPNKDESP